MGEHAVKILIAGAGAKGYVHAVEILIDLTQNTKARL